MSFLSYPVSPLEELPNWDFDALLIADLQDVEKIQIRLMQQHIPNDKVVTLLPS
jgi:hypothetical protein